MPSFWNFRKILHVDPENDRTCVGTTQKGAGCRNPINMSDRATAGRLLNQMDGSKSFKIIIDELESLAALLLCKGVHNNLNRAHLSQVYTVSSKWTIMVEEEHRIMKNQKEKAKMLKAKKELLRIAENAKQMKAELEDEGVDQVSPWLQHITTCANFSKAPHKNSRYGAPTCQNSGWMTGLEDPFVSVTSSAKSSSVTYNPTNPKDTQRTQPAKSTDKLKKSDTLVRVKEVASSSSGSIPQLKENIGLPTPESTPEDLKDPKTQDQSEYTTPSKPPKQPNEEKPMQPLTPPSSIKVTRQTTEFTFEYGPGLKFEDTYKSQFGGLNTVTDQPWSFPVFNDTNEPDGDLVSKSSLQKQLALNSPDAQIPRIPLGTKNTSSHNNMKKKKSKHTEYEFGNQENMPFKNFSFETNTPGSMLANLAPSPAPVLNTFFVFDQSSEETSSALGSKDTQHLTECQLPAAVHSKSEIQPKSKSQPILKIESSSMPEQDFDIKTPPMSTFYQDTDNDSITDIGATTAPTSISPQAKSNLSTPPSKTKSPSSKRPSPSYGTALIIPSTNPSFKTHLPSRRSRSQYTPFPSTSQPRTSTSPESYKADLQIWERITAMDKPLPSLPWEPLKREKVEMKSEMEEDDEEEIKCLGSRRLGRVRRRILGVLGRR